MTKIQGLLRSILILCLFLSVKVEKAEAFFLIPPLPPEPVVDFPDEGGKIVSTAQAAYQKLYAIDSKLATLRLDAIKKGDLFAIKEAIGVVRALTEGGKKKSPNKGTVAENSDLNIKKGNNNKGLLDEEAFFLAHNALFFTYPSVTINDKIDSAFMRTVYESKGAQYRQDMLIDTYLTARLMEDYLVTVERTINRLDACQKNPDPEHCTFFGITMADVKSLQEAPKGGEGDDNAGQLGATTNAYIVTMVYDRLMRLVEDLTATEALYQSSKQTDMADPVYPGANESNASDYVPQKYHFAYSTTHEHSHAKGLLNEAGFNRLDCKPGERGCPAKNKEGEAKKIMDDTEIMTKLKPIDNILTEAMTIHNLKNQLPSYKVQYRKYLRSIENHKRALQAVYDSDKCIVDFFMRHDANGVIDPDTKEERKLKEEEWDEYWGTPKGVGEQPTEDGYVFDYEKDYNDYEKRGGMSLSLIKEYQSLTENTILGTSYNTCENYYSKGQCPDGYKSDTDHPCSEDKSLYPCVIENAVEFDSNTPTALDASNMEESPLSDGAEKLSESQKDSLSFDEKDYIASNSDIENIADDNRVRSEIPWRIGSERLIEMTGRFDHKILFNSWNDQKDLQTEYLRQKYHNITSIIKSTDKGWVSFKIAQSLSEQPDEDEDESEMVAEIKAIINGGQTCRSVPEAIALAEKDKCSGDVICDIHESDTPGIIEYEISEEDEEGNIVVIDSGTFNQYVSKGGPNCEYKKNGKKPDIMPTKGTNCLETWDFTKGFLVSRYLRCVIAGDEYDKTKLPPKKAIRNDSDKFYLTAKARGRVVARNKLEDVMWTRIGTAAVVKATVEDYELKMDAYGSQLGRAKDILTSYNEAADKATKDKNLIQRLKDRSEKRITSIETEISTIEDRKAKVKLESDICALDYRIAILNHEKTCIDKGTNDFTCPSSCAKLKPELQPEGCKDTSKIAACYNKDKGYTISVAEAMTSQRKVEEINTENDKKSENEAQTPIPDDVKKASNKYVKPTEAALQITAKEAEIKAAQNKKKAMQKEVDKIQEKIDEIALKFMSEDGKHFNELYNKKFKDTIKVEKYVRNKDTKTWTLATYYEVTRDQASYIVTSRVENDKLEYENSKFESLLYGSEESRMTRKDEEDSFCPIGCPSAPLADCLCGKISHPIGSDNLISSLNEFFDEGGTDGKIFSNMDEKWAKPVLDSLGDDEFTIDDSFKLLELPRDAITMQGVAKRIREKVVQKAAEKVVENIEKGDEIISYEMDEAAYGNDGDGDHIVGVKNLTDKYGVSYNEEDQTYQIPTDEQKEAISNASNYKDWHGKRLNVSNDHIKLIDALRKPHKDYVGKKGNRLDLSGINFAEIYGIPDGIEDTWGSVDNSPIDKYFVGLPARGDNKAEDYAENNEDDPYAGKDFMQPNGPLPSLPPVREVFYFDAQDYEDLPRQENYRPSISHLLDKKFPNSKDPWVKTWEYMPEVWRYILARPNLRNDGLYQHTFIESSYHLGRLREMTEGGPGNEIDVSKYGKIIGREGVYPCKIASVNTVIDVSASYDIEGLTFIHGDNLRAYSLCNDEHGSYICRDIFCKEIALNKDKVLDSIIVKENVCHLYNKKENGKYQFCHLAADHGEGKDVFNANGLGEMSEYRKYSELGQFLKVGTKVPGPLGLAITTSDNNLYYRDMQVSIAEYLTNQDNTENDIRRQIAEMSSFKRNILGSFLNTVYSEHSAKKTRDNMRRTVLGSLEGLCKQIHQNGKSVGPGINDEGYMKITNPDDRQVIDKACAKLLTDGEGKVGESGNSVGLAFSRIGEKDTRYGVAEEFTKDQDLYGGITCGGGEKESYYEDVFCKLDDIKAEKLEKAKQLLKEAEVVYQKMADEEGDKQYVLDRLTDINDYITMLEKDENEVVFLTPNMKKGTHGETLQSIDVGATEAFMDSEVRTARTNRTIERATDEESITGMDNGEQIAPYCPAY